MSDDRDIPRKLRAPYSRIVFSIKRNDFKRLNNYLSFTNNLILFHATWLFSRILKEHEQKATKSSVANDGVRYIIFINVNVDVNIIIM